MIRDVKEIEESTLWEETGRQLAARGKNEEEDTRKIVVVVLGEKGSGRNATTQASRQSSSNSGMTSIQIPSLTRLSNIGLRR